MFSSSLKKALTLYNDGVVVVNLEVVGLVHVCTLQDVNVVKTLLSSKLGT
jgi:hypothetical protein